MEFDEAKADQELADSRLAMPDGEFEAFVTGNPFVVWSVLTYASSENLPLAIERLWRACWLNVQDGDLDLAEEIGSTLVLGLTERLKDRTDDRPNENGS